jgi:hypothetical protein
MKLDPGMHIVMHLVFFGKIGGHVSWLGERLEDFPDDFLLGKVRNIESIDTLNKHPILEYICSTPSSSFILNSLSSNLSNSFFFTDLFVTHMDFLEFHPHIMGGLQSKDPMRQLLV